VNEPQGNKNDLVNSKKLASGGKVCHLESWLANAPSPRSSGTSHSLTCYARDQRLLTILEDQAKLLILCVGWAHI